MPTSPQALQVGQEDLIPAVESQPGSEADQIQDKLEAHLAEARPEGNPPVGWQTSKSYLKGKGVSCLSLTPATAVTYVINIQRTQSKAKNKKL